MKTKSLLFIGLAVSALAIAGCNATNKKYDKETKNKTEVVTENTAVMRSMTPAIAACEVGVANREKAAAESASNKAGMPQFTTAQILELKADAQRSYIDKSFTNDLVATMSEQTRMVIMALKKQPITCAQAVAMAVDSYMRKEEVQAKQWGNSSLALAIAVPTALVVKSALKIMDSAIASSGDIQIGELNANASGGKGGGEGSPGGAGGTVDLNLGKGALTKVDNGSTLQSAEKQLINPVTGSGGTNTLDDSGDGSGNQAGINPFGQ